MHAQQMETADLCKMLPKWTSDYRGQSRCSVLLSLAAPDRDLVPVEINILYPEFHTFLQLQTRTVEQHADHPHRAIQVRQDRDHLVSTQHNGKTNRLLGPNHVLHLTDRHLEHPLAQEQQRRQCLVLGRGTNLLARCEPRQEGQNIGCTQGCRVRLPVKAEVPANPCDVGDFRSAAVVSRSDGGRSRRLKPARYIQ